MRKFLIEVIILFSAALIIIFYQFNQIPKNLAFDEVEFAKLALSLDGKPYSAYSVLATGHSTLYFYIILFSFKLFGITNFALRFPSALFGVLNVIIFYFLCKNLFQNYLPSLKLRQASQLSITNYLPFILSFIFLTLHWYFNFARFAFEAAFLLFLELLSIDFLFRFLKNKKLSDILLVGLFSSLAFNSYTPGRIFFILPLFILLTKKQGDRAVVRRMFLGLIVFIIAILPLSYYLLTHQDSRFEHQFFLKNSQLSLKKKIIFLTDNIKRTALMFNFSGDLNGRHNYPGKPALNPILGAFFILGILLALKNYRQFYNQLFLFYFILSLIPTLFTYPWENPHMLRAFTVIPSVVYFIGCAFQKLFSLKMRETYRKYFIVMILCLIFLSSLYEIRTYFIYQSEVFKKAFEIKKPLQQLNFK